MGNANGRAALVTGAGRGIGRAIALELSNEGFAVVANDLEASDELAETVRLIAAGGGRAMGVAADISDLERHGPFVEEAWSAFGGLHCLVNNAGISVARRDDLLKVAPASFDRLIDVNLRGPFFLTQAVAQRMVDEGGAHFRSIVTISSANAEAASIERGEYCIAKSGLAMMTKLFALRLAADGIRVYEVRPGVIRTAMTAVVKERYDGLFAQGLAPINRWGEPEEVGRAVAALASGAFPYSTGEAIHVDGGLLVPRL
jgi:3-oxoacyl-[acyl-carrier protein] reductase